MSKIIPRIGLGWDSHKLVQGEPCILGGVLFDSPIGPKGHSDGDALLHAITDALLGAAGLDDIGTLFPDDDPNNKNRDSAEFITFALKKLQENKLQIASIDTVIICDEPKIGPYRNAIRNNLKNLLGIPENRINVKGKSTEGGEKFRITAQAIALLLDA